jgi:hypothetical protein
MRRGLSRMRVRGMSRKIVTRESMIRRALSRKETSWALMPQTDVRSSNFRPAASRPLTRAGRESSKLRSRFPVLAGLAVEGS